MVGVYSTPAIVSHGCGVLYQLSVTSKQTSQYYPYKKRVGRRVPKYCMKRLYGLALPTRLWRSSSMSLAPAVALLPLLRHETRSFLVSDPNTNLWTPSELTPKFPTRVKGSKGVGVAPYLTHKLPSGPVFLYRKPTSDKRVLRHACHGQSTLSA